jgi:hypothetical protein
LETGKLLSIIGGIITLLATYVFSWFVIDISGTLYYGHGVGVFISLPYTIGNADTIAASWGPDVPGFAIYIVAGVLIFFLISGLLMLFGVKSRALAIIGAIMPIAIAIAVLFGPLSVPPNVLSYISPFSSEALGVYPFNIAIGPSGYGATVALGDYLLLGGGVLGILGGILPRD